LALSTDRAFTVLVLLQQLGINKDKLSFKGFGDTSPIADNNTELGKAKNRRTEFMILTK
jgi:flagellar motor protein MotB